MALPLTVNALHPVYGLFRAHRKKSRCRACSEFILAPAELCSECEVSTAAPWNHDGSGSQVISAHGRFWVPEKDFHSSDFIGRINAAEKLRAQRDASGLSLNRVAKMFDLNAGTLGSIEAGSCWPSKEVIAAYASLPVAAQKPIKPRRKRDARVAPLDRRPHQPKVDLGDANPSEVAAGLKFIRTYFHLSAADLAKLVDLSAATVLNFERGIAKLSERLLIGYALIALCPRAVFRFLSEQEGGAQ